MRELSLFSGAGGGLLGAKWLLGWRTVGYVEWEDYPQRVLAARIQDGLLDKAPIFGDIRAFIRDGYARSYQGMVDVISAGFPCQPFSVAGKRRGDDDLRNMWPATVRCIQLVRPRYALLENVPGLLTSSGYFGTILGDLAESGYDARWRVLSAAELGAPHKRDRLWIVADNSCSRAGMGDRWSGGGSGQERQSTRTLESAILRQEYGQGCTKGIDPSSENVLNAFGGGAKNGRGQWWSTEPDVGRVAHGVAARVDRLKALGNGQVPAVAARAWLELTGGLT